MQSQHPETGAPLSCLPLSELISPKWVSAGILVSLCAREEGGALSGAVRSQDLNLGPHFLISLHSLLSLQSLVSLHSLVSLLSSPKAEPNLYFRLNSSRKSPRVRRLGGMEGKSIYFFHAMLENIKYYLYLEGSPPSSATVPHGIQTESICSREGQSSPELILKLPGRKVII